jgi:hypothetical protein
MRGELVEAPDCAFGRRRPELVEGRRAQKQTWTNPRACQHATCNRPVLTGSWQMQKLVGRTDKSGARGFGCWLWISRPHRDQLVHSRDAASWPSPHMSNSHSFCGPPPFPCPTKVCARRGRVNGLCTSS